jgi:hypothetical protein
VREVISFWIFPLGNCVSRMTLEIGGGGGSRTFGSIENTQVIDSVISLIAPFASFARWVAQFGTISHRPKLRPSLECCHIPPSDLADELNDPFDVERRRPLLSVWREFAMPFNPSCEFPPRLGSLP